MLANEATSKMFGYDLDELINQPLTRIMPDSIGIFFFVSCKHAVSNCIEASVHQSFIDALVNSRADTLKTKIMGKGRLLQAKRKVSHLYLLNN